MLKKRVRPGPSSVKADICQASGEDAGEQVDDRGDLVGDGEQAVCVRTDVVFDEIGVGGVGDPPEDIRGDEGDGIAQHRAEHRPVAAPETDIPAQAAMVKRKTEERKSAAMVASRYPVRPRWNTTRKMMLKVMTKMVLSTPSKA